MAFRAGHLIVPASEQKLRLVVRKFCRRPPCLKTVTTLTCRAKLSAMLIAVTAYAVLSKTEKSLGHPHVLVVGKFFPNKFRLMAVAARRLRMLALQPVTRLFMIEVGLTFFPTYQGKTQAIMLAMTGSAKPGFFFRHRIGVKPALVSQTFGNRSVTLQTFGVARLFANFVTG